MDEKDLEPNAIIVIFLVSRFKNRASLSFCSTFSRRYLEEMLIFPYSLIDWYISNTSIHRFEWLPRKPFHGSIKKHMYTSFKLFHCCTAKIHKQIIHCYMYDKSVRYVKDKRKTTTPFVLWSREEKWRSTMFLHTMDYALQAWEKAEKPRSSVRFR